MLGFSTDRTSMSYSLNSLTGCIGEYIGEHCRAYQGGSWEFRYSPHGISKGRQNHSFPLRWERYQLPCLVGGR